MQRYFSSQKVSGCLFQSGVMSLYFYTTAMWRRLIRMKALRASVAEGVSENS